MSGGGHVMRGAVALLLAVALVGCGLVQTRGPDPRQPRDQRPSCTETFDAPKRDAYGAIGGFVTLLVGLLFLKADDNEDVGVPLIVGGGVVMAASYASGGIGYYRVKRCRERIAEFERASAAAAPQPPQPSQPPPAQPPPALPQPLPADP